MIQNGLLSLFDTFVNQIGLKPSRCRPKNHLGEGCTTKNSFHHFHFIVVLRPFFYILVCIFRFLRSGNAIKVKLFTSGYILYVKLASILTYFLVFLIISVTCTMVCWQVQCITSYIRSCHIGIEIVVLLWFSIALRGPRSALTHILHFNNTAFINPSDAISNKIQQMNFFTIR